MSKDFKSTVFLPQTSFSMKGNLPEKEPHILGQWEGKGLYQKIRERSLGRKKFILHYGPPYANGSIHMGHVLTEILKDIVVKNYQMLGYDAPLVPGWDCHGLPIEWKIEEGYKKKGLNKDDIDPSVFRQECRQFANHWISVQKEEFKRLGIIADWENPYITMDFKAEAAIVAELGKIVRKGGVYKGLKPVLWSVVEKTALAEAEVEYRDHTSDAIYVSFPIVKTNALNLEGASILIWTTTPWTLPANRAIAYGANHTYSLVKVGNKKILIVDELVEVVKEDIEHDGFIVLSHIKGKDLEGTWCQHPLFKVGYDFMVPLLPGDHVTTDTGTGFVHTAPSHGIEDFQVGLAYGLEVPDLVDGGGIYNQEVPCFAGQHIYKVNPSVIEKLGECCNLWGHKKLLHSYPHSWRSKMPLIYRAAPQWFLSMEKNDLRKKALDQIEKVQWFPSQGKNRIQSMIEARPDWCLSRQRAWGAPLTLFVNKKDGTIIGDEDVWTRIAHKIEQHGADAWYTTDPQEFLGEQYDAKDYERVNDILDVWFDSGCTQSFVLKERAELHWPADLYLEGSDQHRGWFHTSLLVSCATDGQAPYKQVLTHGFVVDGQGYKMSKSVGNTVASETLIKKRGADLLRLWVVLCDYTDDIRIGEEILQRQEDVYRRLRNTLRYLLGALDGFSPNEEISYELLPELERYILSKLKGLDQFHKNALKNYELRDFYTALHTFCATDLSAFYFDMRKDTLYCDDHDSIQRRSARTVMSILFKAIVKWLAPVLSFTTEEAWQSVYGENESIHLEDFELIPDHWGNTVIEERWEQIRQIRRVVTGAIEVQRNAKVIGSSLQAHVDVYLTSALRDQLKDMDLAELFITSSAKVICEAAPQGAFTLESQNDIGVVVKTADGQKCQRCWKVLPEVGTLEEDSLCQRCCDVTKT